LEPEHGRQPRLVQPRAVVDVDEVDAARVVADADLAAARLAGGLDIDDLHHLGAAGVLDPDRSHARLTRTVPPAAVPCGMSSAPIAVVTGGAGFIGSHTVDRLVELGHRVIVLDDFRTGKRANLARWADPKHAFAGSSPAVEIVPCDVSHGIFAALAPL